MYILNTFTRIREVFKGSQGNTLHVSKILSVGDGIVTVLSLDMFKLGETVQFPTPGLTVIYSMITIDDQHTGRVLECTARGGRFESLPGLRAYMFKYNNILYVIDLDPFTVFRYLFSWIVFYIYGFYYNRVTHIRIHCCFSCVYRVSDAAYRYLNKLNHFYLVIKSLDSYWYVKYQIPVYRDFPMVWYMISSGLLSYTFNMYFYGF